MIDTTSARYEPSAQDPRILAALGARERLEDAFDKQDSDAAMALAAPDLLVNAPINRVVTLDNIVTRFRSGAIHYESIETKLEFAGVRGDLVVLMGEEIVKPIENTPQCRQDRAAALHRYLARKRRSLEARHSPGHRLFRGMNAGAADGKS